MLVAELGRHLALARPRARVHAAVEELPHDCGPLPRARWHHTPCAARVATAARYKFEPLVNLRPPRIVTVEDEVKEVSWRSNSGSPTEPPQQAAPPAVVLWFSAFSEKPKLL